MTNKVLVIYHDNCADGIMSAAIAKMHMPDAEFFPCNYNSYELRDDMLFYKDEVAYLTNKDIFVIDFSFKHTEILHMAEYANEFTLLDHHKSAQIDLEGQPFPAIVEITFDMNKSGCMLTWEHWHGPSENQAVPAAITYVGGRDIWQHKGKPWELEAEYINYWLMSEPWSIDRALSIVEDSYALNEALAFGEATHKFFMAKVEEAKGHAIITTHYGLAGREDYEDYSCAVVNAPYWLASELGNQLSKEYDFACIWFVTKDAEVGVSLRSSNGTDVSLIAKEFGGGGHAAAAGCKFNSISAFKEKFLVGM